MRSKDPNSADDLKDTSESENQVGQKLKFHPLDLYL